MADFAVLGIGIDPRQAESGGRRVERQLDEINRRQRQVGTTGKQSFGQMAAAVGAGQIAVQAFTKAIELSVSAMRDTVQVGASFESTMKRVQAVSQANSAQFQKLQAAAREMGATTKFSATEAAEGLEFLSMAGFQATQSIEALPGVLQLAAASGVELGRAADIASNALTAMGLEISELGRINDVLLSTTTGANVNINQMAESLKYAAPVAAATGVSIEELSALIGALGNAGIQGSQAGTSLAGAMSRLLNPTKEVSKIMQELNVQTGNNLIETFRDLERAGATSAQIMKIFGEEAGRSLLALQTGGGIAAVDKLTDRLNKAAGTAEKTAKMMGETLDGALKNLSSSIESVQLDIFNQSSDEMTQIIQNLTNMVRSNNEGFVAVGQSVENLIGFFVTLTSDTDALSVALSGVEKSVDAATIVITGLGTIAQTAALRMEYLAAGGAAAILALSGDIDALSFALDDMDRISKKSTESLTDGLSHMLDAFDGIIGKRRELLSVGEGSRKSIENESKAMNQAASSADSVAKKTEQVSVELQAAQNPIQAVTQAIESMTDAQIEQINTSGDTVSQIRAESDALEGLANRYRLVADEVGKTTEKTSRLGNISGRVFDDMDFQRWSETDFTLTVPTGSLAGLGLGGFGYPGFDFGGSAPSVQPQQQTAVPQNTGLVNAANRQIQSLYTGFLNLGDQIEDYILGQKSVNEQLEAYQDRLIEKNRELADLSDEDLERRLELSQDVFAIQKQIDRLSQQNKSSEVESAKSVKSILQDTVNFYEEIALNDIGGLLPVEKFSLVEQKFIAVSEALAGIDWTEITEADQAVIANFRSTAEQYLEEAQEVYKSGDPYQVVKSTVLAQTEDLATKLVGKFEGIDTSTVDTSLSNLSTSLLSLDSSASGADSQIGLRTDSSGLSRAVEDLKWASNFGRFEVSNLSSQLGVSDNSGLRAAAAGAASKTQDVITEFGNNDDSGLRAAAANTTLKMQDLQANLSGTDGFSDALDSVAKKSATAAVDANQSANQIANIAIASSTASGGSAELNTQLSDAGAFKDAASYLSGLQTNVRKTAEYMEQRYSEVLDYVSGGASGVTQAPGTTAPTPTAPVTQTKTFVGFSTRSNMFGTSRLVADYSDGSYEEIPLGYATGVRQRRYDSHTVNGNTATITYGDYGVGGRRENSGVITYSAPNVLSLATGSWNINNPTQPATLHQGEMVIRADDAPAVRSMMRSSGMSESYGVSSSPRGQMQAYSGRMEAMLETLIDLLQNPVAPLITLNGEKINRELDRQRRLQS